MDKIDKDLLAQISDLHKIPEGAYNIRKTDKRSAEIQRVKLKLSPKKTRAELMLL